MTINQITIANREPGFSVFVEKINKDIHELNRLINNYNAYENGSIKDLKKILRQMQCIENQYSDKHVRCCFQFLTEMQNLFVAIQMKFKDSSISSLSENINASNIFSDLLINMEPEKVNELTDMLSKGSKFNQNELRKLYPEGANKPFEDFYSRYDISFLGGNNSFNFLMTEKNTQSSYVLKVENRLGMPKLPEIHLRNHSLQNILIPMYAERQGILNAASDKREIRRLVVTDFCPGGDLVAHSKQQKNADERIKSALSLYNKMLDTLIGISNDGCIFPDMKNTNWLVDANNNLVIADPKSFYFSDENGNLNFNNNKCPIADIPTSKHLNPPEYTNAFFMRGEPISANKMHAFIFGENLYQYLTGCTEAKLTRIKGSISAHFDFPVFKTIEGEKLKKLIEQMLEQNPEKRISLEEIRTQLNPAVKELRSLLSQIKIDYIDSFNRPIGEDFLKYTEDLIKQNVTSESGTHLKNELMEILNKNRCLVDELKRENLAILDRINRTGFGEMDIQMNDFISANTLFIKTCATTTDLKTLASELKTILKDQQAVTSINEIITKLEKKGNRSQSKIDKIKGAICNIPIEQRGKIHDSQFDLGREVHLAVASHRHFSFFRSVKFNHNEINEKEASRSFKELKSKLKEQREVEPDLNELIGPKVS